MSKRKNNLSIEMVEEICNYAFKVVMGDFMKLLIAASAVMMCIGFGASASSKEGCELIAPRMARAVEGVASMTDAVESVPRMPVSSLFSEEERKSLEEYNAASVEVAVALRKFLKVGRRTAYALQMCADG